MNRERVPPHVAATFGRRDLPRRLRRARRVLEIGSKNVHTRLLVQQVDPRETKSAALGNVEPFVECRTSLSEIPLLVRESSLGEMEPNEMLR